MQTTMAKIRSPRSTPFTTVPATESSLVCRVPGRYNFKPAPLCTSSSRHSVLPRSMPRSSSPLSRLKQKPTLDAPAAP
jgi:hypothetical protein